MSPPALENMEDIRPVISTINSPEQDCTESDPTETRFCNFCKVLCISLCSLLLRLPLFFVIAVYIGFSSMATSVLNIVALAERTYVGCKHL